VYNYVENDGHSRDAFLYTLAIWRQEMKATPPLSFNDSHARIAHTRRPQDENSAAAGG